MKRVSAWIGWYALGSVIFNGAWIKAQDMQKPEKMPVQNEREKKVTVPPKDRASQEKKEAAPKEMVKPVPKSVEKEPMPVPPDEPKVSKDLSALSQKKKVAEEQMPKKIVEQETFVEEQPTLGPDEIMVIDTVDHEDPQGNCLFKRVLWERAESKYEKIRNAVNKILELRTGFFAKRAELDKTVLDPFYIKIGLNQGELEEMLSELIARTAKDAAIVERAEADKQELERLQKQVEDILKQDHEVDDVIQMLIEQINTVRTLEQQAWQNFKDIARILDDKKARELFYTIDNAWRNIQELQHYIEQTYSNSFHQLVNRIKEHINQVDNAVVSLHEKGIILKNRAQEQQDDDQEEQEESPKGMIERYIIDPIKGIAYGIWSLIRWPIDVIAGMIWPKSADDQPVEGDRSSPMEQERMQRDDEQDEQMQSNQPETVPGHMMPDEQPSFEVDELEIDEPADI